MNDCASSTTTGFVLAPRRDGALLPLGRPHHESCDQHSTVNQSHHNRHHDNNNSSVLAVCCACRLKQRSVVSISEGDMFGRGEFWSALRRACPRGSCCSACREVLQWIPQVPRALIQARVVDLGTAAESSEKGNVNHHHQVWIWVQRKKYCYISNRLIKLVRRGDTIEMNAIPVAQDDNDDTCWLGPTVLEPGDILQFHRQLEDETTELMMEFQLCRLGIEVLQQGGDPVVAQESTSELSRKHAASSVSGKTEKRRRLNNRGIVLPKFDHDVDLDIRASDDDMNDPGGAEEHGIASQPESQPTRKMAETVRDSNVNVEPKSLYVIDSEVTAAGKGESNHAANETGSDVAFGQKMAVADDTKKTVSTNKSRSATLPLTASNKSQQQTVKLPTILSEVVGIERQTSQGIVDQASSQPGALSGVDNAPSYKNSSNDNSTNTNPLPDAAASFKTALCTRNPSPALFAVEAPNTRSTVPDQATTDQGGVAKLPDTMRSSNVQPEKPLEPAEERTKREDDERLPREKVASDITETKKASSAPLPANPFTNPYPAPGSLGVSAQLLGTSEQKQLSMAKPAAMPAPTLSLGPRQNGSRAIPNPLSSHVPIGSKASEASPRDVESAPDEQFILYVCPLGKDLQGWRYDGVVPMGIKEKARQRGAVVLDSFNKSEPPWPNHLVISWHATDDEVPLNLGFENRDEMVDWLESQGIACVKPEWIVDGVQFSKVRKPPPLRRPTIMHLRQGFSRKNKRIRRNLAGVPSSGRDVDSHADRNKDLSELFRRISKMYQECPLDKPEKMKSFAFQKASGRLRYLDFEVTNDADSIKRLRKVKFFGTSMVDIVKDYFARGDGTCGRLRMLETEKDRIGIREVKKIWGVGEVKAWELVRDGYRRIGDVRRALKEGRLKLDRNQYIGVKYYEDMQEKMSRSEVEAIAQIVAKTVRDRFPQAEINIMGSYRRGKEMCGDADIIIWHPEFVDEVPPKALGKIVDQLCKDGHIEHHLTFIAGMDPAKFETLDPKVARKLINPETFGRAKEKSGKTEGSMWMGVFNSPMVKGLHRHVDIKFYPYSERVYATLYFTGNGYFNRSMRLWAKKEKYKLKLSDHGLFTKMGVCMLPNPETEKEVFDYLGLKWKEPHEREYFDDVQSSTPGEHMAVLEMDFSKED